MCSQQDNDEIEDNDCSVQLFAGQRKNSIKRNKTLSSEKIAELHQEKVRIWQLPYLTT